METFHLLSRGGAKFDKQRFGKDVKLFNSASSKNPIGANAQTSKTLNALKTGELPTELDFFKYAAGENVNQSSASKKGKQKAQNDEELQGDEDEDVGEDGPSTSVSGSKKGGQGSRTPGTWLKSSIFVQIPPKLIRVLESANEVRKRHRIATTGKEVPAPIASFDNLLERYSIPPQLLKNLAEHGYSTPTAIQSQGVPVLLEVSLVADS